MWAQLLLRDFKPIVEGKLKEIVEDGGWHMVQVDEALCGLSHSGLGQGSKVLATLWKSSKVHLKKIIIKPSLLWPPGSF